MTNSYDALGQLTQTTDGDGGKYTYTYDDAGNVTKLTYPNGWVEEYSYDAEGNLLKTVDTDPFHNNKKSTKYQYTYDAEGNLITEYQRDSDGEAGLAANTTYSYDALNRLTGSKKTVDWTRKTYAKTYTYDSLGNLVQENGPDSRDQTTYQYNSLNQMTARKECGYVQSITRIHDYGYTYDGRGNLIKEEEICSPTTQGPKNITIATYTYDETNKMVSGTNKDGEVSNYTFNGLGVRVGTEVIVKDNTHGYTDFHCQTPTVETGIDKPEVVLSDYVIDYTRLNIDQRVLVKSETDGYDFRYTYGLDLVNVKATGEGTNWWAQSVKKCVYSDYVHTDRLGSVVNLTDQYGRVPAQVDYDDWGKVTAYQSLNISGGYRTVLPEITYAGHQYDDVLGMYYAKARMYDAENRRFASVDPVKGQITEPMTMVQYLYVVDDPLRWVDLLGDRYTLAQGTIAHAIIEAYIAFIYSDTIIDQYVYGVGRTKSKRGRPDVAIVDQGKYHIYEIKSDAYLKKPYSSRAYRQLKSYVDALNNFPNLNQSYLQKATVVPPAQKGTILNWEKNSSPIYDRRVILPYIPDAHKVIEAWTEKDIPGMIYYKIRDKRQNEKEESQDFVTDSLRATIRYYAMVSCEYAPDDASNLIAVDSYGDVMENDDIISFLDGTAVSNIDGVDTITFEDGTTYYHLPGNVIYNNLYENYGMLLDIYEGELSGYTKSWPNTSSSNPVVPFLPLPNVSVPVPAPMPVPVPLIP